jgi:hypothetical protein
MKDVRECHYHHPIFGVMRKDLESNYYNTEGNLYIPEGIELETIYERDRRLWVEQIVVTDLARRNNIVNDDDLEFMIGHYCNTYDLIQKSITNFQTNK